MSKCYDIILLILNCKKYREKAIVQKNTWLKTIPSNIKYYHVIGDKEKCNGQDIYVDENESIIYTNTLDDYNSLPSKVITALAGIHSKFDFKYVFKTDDDQKLIIGDFFIQLQKALTMSQYHYGGFIISCKEHISDYYKVHDCLPRDLYMKSATYATGRFYLLSRIAVEDLINKRKGIEQQLIEDHAMGLFIDKQFIIGALDINTPNAFADVDAAVNRENTERLFLIDIHNN
jgi:hypothetical protein